MKYLFLLRGLPASGKDYFIDRNNLRPWTLSSDEYRMRCGVKWNSVFRYPSYPYDCGRQHDLFVYLSGYNLVTAN